MYVRGASVSRGCHRSEWEPAASCTVRRPTRRGAAAPSPLAKAPSVTRAGCPSRNRTTAASRKPSPFGETVAKRVLSPAYGGPSLATETPLSSSVVRARQFRRRPRLRTRLRGRGRPRRPRFAEFRARERRRSAGGLRRPARMSSGSIGGARRSAAEAFGPAPASVGATNTSSLSTRSAARNAPASVGPPSSRSVWTPSPASAASSSAERAGAKLELRALRQRARGRTQAAVAGDSAPTSRASTPGRPPAPSPSRRRPRPRPPAARARGRRLSSPETQREPGTVTRPSSVVATL